MSIKTRGIDVELRQFRLLSRDAVRRLLDRALHSRGSDPMYVLIWATALLLTPPLMYAANRLLRYRLLASASDEAMVRFATGDRLFFLTYTTLALTLLAALTWDAFFPDPREQEITASLPVRPRTAAAARFVAGTVAALGVSAAITAPGAFVYAFISATHPAVGPLWRVLIGHVVSVVLCALFVFFTLLSIRGLLAILGNARVAEWTTKALQTLTMVLLVDALLFLPRIIPRLVGETFDGGSWRWLPPVWFVALYSELAGTRHNVPRELTQTALAAVAISTVVAVAIYLLSARWMSRRALLMREGSRPSVLVACARWLAGVIFRNGQARSIFVFAAATIARSRRHSTMLAMYVGVAVASAVLGILTAGVQRADRRSLRARQEWGSVIPPLDEPGAYWLAIPLIFIFFAVMGLRAASRVPTDVDANWAFKVPQPRLGSVATATQTFWFLFGVVPVIAVTAAATFLAWPPAVAAQVVAFDLLAGVFLTECALFRWGRVPFACEHAAVSQTVKWHWVAFLLALNLFAFRVADVQMIALASAGGAITFVAVAAGAIVLVRVLRRRGIWRETLEFDVASPETPGALDLSSYRR